MEKVGGPRRTRTCDPLIKSQLLYQAELAAHSGSWLMVQGSEKNKVVPGHPEL